MIDIERLIPHRPPFLFVDRVIEIDDNSIVAEKWLDPELDFFKGHYPHFPLMPGALTCEAVFQAGAILLSRRIETDAEGAPVLTRIRDARFKKMVRPGDTLTLKSSIAEVLGQAFYMSGEALVDGARVVRVEYTCAYSRLPQEA